MSKAKQVTVKILSTLYADGQFFRAGEAVTVDAAIAAAWIASAVAEAVTT